MQPFIKISKDLVLKYLEKSDLRKYVVEFSPELKNNFEEDKNNFSEFWGLSNKYILNSSPKLKRSKKEMNAVNSIKSFSENTKKIFLRKYSSHIYNILTKNMNRFISLDQIVYDINNVVPNMSPTKKEISIENKKVLKEKEGLEISQALVISSILQLNKEGNHLCHALMLPSQLAKEAEKDFNKNGKVDFGGASVEKLGKYNIITLKNPKHLNAEDEETLLPLEAAIDLALMDDVSEICVLRGGIVNHPKYANKRIFGSGINLTHLYNGKISYLWYIKRDMGAVNKVFRGIAHEEFSIDDPFFPTREKPWIATLDTFAIGGGCQYLLVMDHIIADKDSYMTLPARKEGIIPGVANLRLWRFTDDRIARQAIQNGLRIDSNSKQGSFICDELIDPKFMEEKLINTINSYISSGVVGSSSNRRAFRIGQEPLDVFRKYMATYCHDQAYCHFSEALIKNLENYWNAAEKKLY